MAAVDPQSLVNAFASAMGQGSAPSAPAPAPSPASQFAGAASQAVPGGPGGAPQASAFGQAASGAGAFNPDALYQYLIQIAQAAMNPHLQSHPDTQQAQSYLQWILQNMYGNATAQAQAPSPYGRNFPQ